MLDARSLALQGLSAPYPLTAIAIAVQGMAATQAAPEQQPVPAEAMRPPIVGRGPGTTINYSDFYKPAPAKPRQLVAIATRRAATRRRQRMETEVLHLLSDF